MKKDSSKNLKHMMISLSLGSLVLANSTFAQSIVPKSASYYEDELKAPSDVLYGAAIDSCQTISSSWKKNQQLDFSEFINLELAKAARRANDRLFEDGGKDGIESLYASNKDKYFEYFLTYKNEQIPQSNQQDEAYPEPQRFKNFVEKRSAAYSSYVKAGESALDKIVECIALHTVITKAPSTRGMAYSEFNKSQESQSYDGKLKCSSIGYETQDYKACDEATGFYDAVFLGRQAVETVQGLQYMDSSMDIQSDLAANAQTDATAGLKAQQEDIKVKANMARTRAATETAAVAALWTAMGKLPDIETLTNECTNGLNNNAYTEAYQSALSLFTKNVQKLETSLMIDSNEKDSDMQTRLENKLEASCNVYIANVGNTASHALIQNSEAKQTIEQALIDSGMNIVTMMGTAEIYDKQASRVGDAIKLVEDHDPETLAYDSEDILATECQINPGSENCVSAQYERGVGYSNNGINVSGLQFATSDSTLPIDEYSRDTDAASDSTNRTNTVGGIGATINPADKGSGLAESPIAAASVSSTGANGLGSGGGGGGSGGGGASAPANGSAQTGGSSGSQPYVGSSKKLKYSSSGGGLSFSSGSKRVATKAKAANPFSSLFGKKTAKSNGVLNFRGVASDVGSKNGSIFQMISKRYSAVSKDERLEQYQKVNE